MKNLLSFAGLAVTFFAATPPVAAHPHISIDLRTTLVLKDDGKAVAIEQEWLFDEFYTMFMTSGAGNKMGGPEPSALREIARKGLENLKNHDYFTTLVAGEKPVRIGTVTEYDAEIRQQRLWMRFVVPLEDKPEAAKQELVLAVYDPSYYVEIVYLQGETVRFRGGSLTCTGETQMPAPGADARSLANALGVNDTAPTSFGELFAEKAVITCK
jgi:ABC-type uncharacterized transport system substrate-binding protein